jgi:hypothetical protein
MERRLDASYELWPRLRKRQVCAPTLQRASNHGNKGENEILECSEGLVVGVPPGAEEKPRY